jgi:hypothetical protein
VVGKHKSTRRNFEIGNRFARREDKNDEEHKQFLCILIHCSKRSSFVVISALFVFGLVIQAQTFKDMEEFVKSSKEKRGGQLDLNEMLKFFSESMYDYRRSLILL